MPASLVTRLEHVRSRIAAAAVSAGRVPSSVKLIAVSKTHSAALIREAYGAGQRAFGESYAQELTEKAVELSDLADIEWHFIGHLQTNKAKLVAKVAHVIHTIDKADLVAELEKRLFSGGRTMLALAEVNVSGEAQKHGVPPAGLASLLSTIESAKTLSLAGLMTMPPADDADAAAHAFDGLRTLQSDHGGVTRLAELSMGMSDDLELAVAHGATMVRIGTAIFGARDYGEPAT